MVFDLETVLNFNEWAVTTDVPDDEDLETPLEVGAWAWNWMEPPLGTASFFLLCMQYARNQLQNLDAKPFTAWMLHRRADNLCKQFPKYNANTSDVRVVVYMYIFTIEISMLHNSIFTNRLRSIDSQLLCPLSHSSQAKWILSMKMMTQHHCALVKFHLHFLLTTENELRMAIASSWAAPSVIYLITTRITFRK